MSKQREGLPDLMDTALGGIETAPASIPKPDLGELKTYSIRIHTKIMEQLRAHFAAQGISLSAGVRQWLIQRMQSEGLR